MPELGTWLIRRSRCVGTFWDHAADAGTQLNIFTLKFREGWLSAGDPGSASLRLAQRLAGVKIVEFEPCVEAFSRPS